MRGVVDARTGDDVARGVGAAGVPGVAAGGRLSRRGGAGTADGAPGAVGLPGLLVPGPPGGAVLDAVVVDDVARGVHARRVPGCRRVGGDERAGGGGLERAAEGPEELVVVVTGEVPEVAAAVAVGG